MAGILRWAEAQCALRDSEDTRIRKHILCKEEDSQAKPSKLESPWCTEGHPGPATGLKLVWIEGHCVHVHLVSNTLPSRRRLRLRHKESHLFDLFQCFESDMLLFTYRSAH